MSALLIGALLLVAGAGENDGPILLLPVDGPPAAAVALEAALARTLRHRLGDDAVLSHGELNVTLTAERTKDMLGCDDVACLDDVLGALGGRWAIGITLVEGEPLNEVVLILRDLYDAHRTFRIERRTPSLMPARLDGLAADLATSIAEATGWKSPPTKSATDLADAPRPAGSGGRFE